MARLGVLDEQQGYRDGPIFLRCPIASWCASHLAAIGIVARLITRERTGHAGPAHTRLAQGALVPMAMHWRRGRDSRRRRWPIGMPKGMTGATLFESGDGVWIHLMGDPTQVADVHRGDRRVVRPDGPPRSTRTRCSSRPTAWPEALAAAPERRVAGVVLGQRRAGAARARRSGAIFADEQARTNGYVVEVDHPELGHDRDGRLAGHGHAADTRCSALAPALGAHTDEVLAEWRAARARRAGDRHRAPQHPLAGRAGASTPAAFLAGPLGPMLLERPRRRRGEGRSRPAARACAGSSGRSSAASAASAASRSTSSRPTRGAALDALLAVGRHPPPQPAHARGAPARPRRGDGARGQPRHRLLPHQLVRAGRVRAPTGPATTSSSSRRAAGRSPARARATTPMWHRFGFMDHLCAMGR